MVFASCLNDLQYVFPVEWFNMCQVISCVAIDVKIFVVFVRDLEVVIAEKMPDQAKCDIVIVSDGFTEAIVVRQLFLNAFLIAFKKSLADILSDRKEHLDLRHPDGAADGSFFFRKGTASIIGEVL